MIRRVLALSALIAVAAAAEGERKTFAPDYKGLDSIRATIYTSYGPMVFALSHDKTRRPWPISWSWPTRSSTTA